MATLEASMAALQVRTAPVISLPTDIVEEDFEFRDTARIIPENLDRHSSAEQYRSCVNIAVEAVGKDPLRLFAFIDVVHDKILNKWSWATGPAIDIYGWDDYKL